MEIKKFGTLEFFQIMTVPIPITCISNACVMSHHVIAMSTRSKARWHPGNEAAECKILFHK